MYLNGNHDTEGNLNGSQIIRLDQKLGGLSKHS